MPRAETAARALQGTMRLRFDGDNRTRLAEISHTPPFQPQRLLFLDAAHPRLASFALLNASAGLFAGDRLSLDVRVCAGAEVTLHTPTMTRAYAMPEDHAQVEVRVSVAEGAYLEYLPQPTLLCAGAALRQSFELEVQPGGVAACGEVLCFGRIAHGERFAQRDLSQRLELRFGDRTALTEALTLTDVCSADAAALLGGMAAYGTLHLFCRAASEAEVLARVRGMMESAAGCWAGASLLHDAPAVGVRVLGESAQAVQRLLEQIAAAFRSWQCP